MGDSNDQLLRHYIIQIKDHIGKYGAYGIGLSKNWAKRNKLSPVQYISTGSHLAQSIVTIITKSVTNVAVNIDTLPEEDLCKLDLLRYIKNYEGYLVRKGHPKHPDYRYYDEREWRHVPKPNKKFKTMVNVPEGKDLPKLDLNKTVSDQKLRFSPQDIKYIIVDSDEEISEVINVLRERTWLASPVDIERLATRILTREQIESDF